jgi:small GTP-binding protein
VIVSTSDGRVADINLHGGEWVVRACLELARQNGFELVEHLPDESLRTLQQEITTALPLARTEPAIRMLLTQEQLWGRIQPDTNAIRAILEDKTLWWMLHPPKIAIVGAANVGKSTLANQLFGQERSITADVPGTTRDWVGDWTNIDGLPVLLIDTPGLRESDDLIEQAAIGHSRRQIREADLLIGVLDPTRPLEPQLQAIPYRGQNRLVVINKSDLPAVWDLRAVDAVLTVATSGEGIDKLRQRIRDRFTSAVSEPSPRWWTPRQRSILERALLDPVALAKLV